MTSGQGTFIVLPYARQQLRIISKILAERNLERAQKFLSDARDTMVFLADAPLMGSPQPQDEPRLHSLRRFRVQNHRPYWIYYRPFVSGNGIEVFGVVHEKQNVAEQLEAALEP